MISVGAWLAAHDDLDRLDRDVLLERAAGLSRAQILTRPEAALEAGAAERLNAWAGRRRSGEPLAYILGSREFWSLELTVSPAVLVPRPETELLVEVGLEFMDGRAGQTIAALELGTGSGAVAIALAREARFRAVDLRLTATDVSPAALQIAAANARHHHTAIDFRHSDWWQEVRGRFALILSNPPYVRDADVHLDALQHEPRLALAGGADGLNAIRTIIAGAAARLETGGLLALEHGWDQAGAVQKLLEAAGFRHVASRADLAGVDRVTVGYLAAS
ncbi:MAG: peptide chain release factor N(5)-glutamine methyltransferase [Gammaproteobacteria bacterium]|nr:peptide chain release factor N(5)-glutamine methyltransferase [Gammaproteobacteria bacterium]